MFLTPSTSPTPYNDPSNDIHLSKLPHLAWKSTHNQSRSIFLSPTPSQFNRISTPPTTRNSSDASRLKGRTGFDTQQIQLLHANFADFGYLMQRRYRFCNTLVEERRPCLAESPPVESPPHIISARQIPCFSSPLPHPSTPHTLI